MRLRKSLLAVGLGALLTTSLFHQVSAAPKAPRLRISDLEQLRTPLPVPYNDRLSPDQVDAQIDAAFTQARQNGKRVIVDLGGNWCSWCRILAAVIELPEARPFVEAHFEIVQVATSVERQGRLTPLNAQVLKRFKVRADAGVPWLVIAEPDGTLVTSSNAATDDYHHTPQSMIDWLARQAKDIPDAGRVTSLGARKEGL